MGYHTKWVTPTTRLVRACLKQFVLQHATPQRVRGTETTWAWDNNLYGYRNGGHVKIGTRQVDRKGFFKVTKPMHVFKKIWTRSNSNRHCQAVVNLILPVGTLIYTDHDHVFNCDTYWSTPRKMRASQAFVHSIVRVSDMTHVQQGWAGYNMSSTKFKYDVGAVVKPVEKFSRDDNQCSSGIHFFINLADAMEWSL